MHPTNDNKSRHRETYNTIHNMKQFITLQARYTLLIAFALMAMCSYAFPLSKHAQSSVLASGKWVKISVPESGAYKITKSQLQQWGFNNASEVRVHGYGGNRIADRLNASTYIDDLPVVQTITTDDGGVIFYGVGPEKWTESSGEVSYDSNIYTREGYYFVTQNAETEVPALRTQGPLTSIGNPSNEYKHRIHYETESYSPGEAGYLLVGENFKSQSERKFTFDTPDCVDTDSVYIKIGIVSKTFVTVPVEIHVNGQKLPTTSANNLTTVTNSAYLHGAYNTISKSMKYDASKLELTIKVNNATSTQNVWLDYINVSYKRKLSLPTGNYLKFWGSQPDLKLTTSDTDVKIWDVTDPLKITELTTMAADGSVAWSNDYTGVRTYVAFTKNATIPAPTFVSTVANQNIHGMDTPDMVIFTLPEYLTQAERIASLHENSQYPLNVAVLNVDAVYNEFASGMADVSALRKCLKMFYDRSATSENTIGYALLLGRSTYDNRHYTSQFSSAGAYNTIPYWIGGLLSQQLSDNTAYGTDDFIAMLEDGSGTNLGIDKLCVAVGRIPVTSASEAKNYVDKLYQYVNEAQTGTWKNSFLFLADDGDNGVHLNQTERMISEMKDVPGQQNFVTKVYVDAYDIIGGVCQGGRNELYRMLTDGVMWWNYSGHANNHSWTGEGILTYTDINNLYLRKVPIVMAATCDFLRWDSNTLSGGEIMFHERNGGAIAMISATRPVYIADNGLFTSAMGRAIATRDSEGRLGRLGDIYRTAKNNILTDSENPTHSNNPNRLRYVLMGDPAMLLPTPNNTIKIESIGGTPLTQENQVTIKALEQTEISGSIYSPSGEAITDFDGTININIYDAERSMVTKGERDENVKISFQQHGNLLFSGSAIVTGGKFTIKVSMPGEVSDNFLPALINSYACSTDKTKEAVGINSEFYVYGYDETVEPDNVPPVIESIVLNHETFNDGDIVNPSPMVLATVSDNVGINLSGAGVGHQMTITLDGKNTYTDVANYYTPSVDGSPSGEIRYPMSDLAAGSHTLTLKIWDTNANSSTAELSFKVDDNAAPTIFDIYTDVNPASTEVKFYIQHNRPDAQLTATVTVYDLLGHELWTTTSEGMSDMFLAAPISWDLTDATGRRLPRGIYLYRATISTDKGDHYDSATRRLAITAQ